MRIQVSSGRLKTSCQDACASLKITQADGRDAVDLAALAKVFGSKVIPHFACLAWALLSDKATKKQKVKFLDLVGEFAEDYENRVKEILIGMSGKTS